jgi:hypothetical protein
MITETEFPESAGADTGPLAIASSASPEVAPSAPADLHRAAARSEGAGLAALAIAQAILLVRDGVANEPWP